MSWHDCPRPRAAPRRRRDRCAPHPHIGLATITYLFRDEIMLRDSLGSVQLPDTAGP